MIDYDEAGYWTAEAFRLVPIYRYSIGVISLAQ